MVVIASTALYLSTGALPFAMTEASGLVESVWNNDDGDMELSLWNWSTDGGFDVQWDDGVVGTSDASFGLRMVIAVVYLAVCVVGLLGNGLVMYLTWAKRRSGPVGIINIFVFGLAVADFQFSLTLPFWATETALDYSWLFGQALCKAIPSLTVLSIYFNAFLLTAMSVTRYRSMASAVKGGSRLTFEGAKRITCGLWALALGVTMPTFIYATEVDVGKEKLCLLKFPTSYLLGVYHLLRVVFTFTIPLAIIATSYLLLIRFLRTHHMRGNHSKRQRQVATTISLIIACFFICWFPNHLVTFWGVLVKFKAVPAGKSFYFLHTYIFPLTTCLAHASSCLNPILYCLIRQEFREAMKDLFKRFSSVASSCQPFTAQKSGEDAVALPLAPASSDNASNAQVRGKEDCTFSTALELRAVEGNLNMVEVTPGIEMSM